MSGRALRIATRSSDLALWQAEHIAARLRAVDPDRDIEFVAMTTHADRHLEVPIAQIGGKGIFAKEVQLAVLEGRADLAVHSAKDLTAVTGDGLCLGAVPVRGDPRDALAGATLEALAPGATVGTGSARRGAQLKMLRPDLSITGLRGNIATRLARIGELDAIMVAAAALERLGLADRAGQVFSVDAIVPQVAQGALAVECRDDDEPTIALLGRIEHAPSRLCVDAERAFLAHLGGDCDLPAGAHATLDDGELSLVGVLAPGVEQAMVRHEERAGASSEGARRLGVAVADALSAAIATPRN